MTVLRWRLLHPRRLRKPTEAIGAWHQGMRIPLALKSLVQRSQEAAKCAVNLKLNVRHEELTQDVGGVRGEFVAALNQPSRHNHFAPGLNLPHRLPP